VTRHSLEMGIDIPKPRSMIEILTVRLPRANPKTVATPVMDIKNLYDDVRQLSDLLENIDLQQ
jgi:hypothetical protein